MELIHTVAEMKARAQGLRLDGRRLALVPTMGALHEGHLALVKEAARKADVVAVSIFVNPTQFGPHEDFGRYPRTLDEDVKLLRTVDKVDCVFAPGVSEMYPGMVDGREPIHIKVRDLDAELCGKYRAGHFDGVVTIVAKLLNIVRPDIAVLGLKDAQQFVILKRLVSDFFFDVEMIGVPTVREDDGLAMSSRNQYLTGEERRQAVVLSRAVAGALQRIRSGEQRVSRIVTAMLDEMASAPAAKAQYAQVVDATSLRPLDVIEAGQETLVAVAAYFGATRLIDSGFITAPTPS